MKTKVHPSSFIPYPSYKPSGVEWLGDVPEHWVALPLKRIVGIPVTDGPHETPEILDEGIPFISAEAIRSNKIDFNRKRGYISESEHRRFCLKYHPKRDDIYMIKSGATTGNLAIVETDEEFSIWSPLAVIRVNKKKADSRFVLAAMNSKEFQTSVQLFWSYGTQQNIGMNVIENLSIPLPPLPEQQAIAAFLDRETGRIDELIAKKERLLELLAEQRTALISRAVTKGLYDLVKPDDPDFSQWSRLHPSSFRLRPSGVEWLGDVPEHWGVKRLKYYVQLITKKAEDSCENPVALENIESWTGRFIETETEFEGEGILFLSNDVLFGKLRPYLAKVLLAERQGESIGDIFVLRPQFDVTSKYLAFTLRTDIYIDVIDGSTFGSKMPRVSWEFMGSLLIPLPPLLEQQAIAAFLDRETARIDALSTKVTKVIEKLREYRTTLISAAVTGKIDVREAV